MDPGNTEQAGERRRARLYAGLVVALALAVRLQGIQWGLPYQLDPDEPLNMTSALRVLTRHTLDPDHWNYPALHPTVVAVLVETLAALGLVHDPPLTGEYPTCLLAARLLSVLAGTAAVALTVRLAARLTASMCVATLAGAFLAVMPIHVRESQRATVDALASLLALAAADLALAAVVPITAAPGAPLEARRRRSLDLAGVMAGLAASVKYNVGACVLWPCTALVAGAMSAGAGDAGDTPAGETIGKGGASTGEASPSGRTLATRRLAGGLMRLGLLSAAAFVLGSPAMLVRARTVLQFLLHDYEHYAWGTMALRSDTLAYGRYLLQLHGQCGLAGSVLGVLGVAGLWRASRPGLVLAGFPFLYFLLIGSFRADFPRTLMPLLPVVAVAMALGVEVPGGCPPAIRRGGGVLAALLTALAMGAAAVGLASQLDGLTRFERSRLAAKQWIEENVPAGSRIAIEWNGPPLNEWPAARQFDVSQNPFCIGGDGGLAVLARRGFGWVVESGQYERLKDNPLAAVPGDPRHGVLGGYEDLHRLGKLTASFDDVRIWELPRERKPARRP